MKKVILGSVMFLSGLLSAAVLLAGTMSHDWTTQDGYLSSFWNMSQYGIMPAFYLFAGIAVLGMGIAIWGVFEKKE